MGQIAIGLIFCCILYTVGGILIAEYEQNSSFKEDIQENIIFYIILFIVGVYYVSRTPYGLFEKIGLIIIFTGLSCYFWSLLRTLWFEKIVLARLSGAPIWQLILKIILFVLLICIIFMAGDPGPETYWEIQAGN